MARSFLTKAKLPKKFWHWAIREANIRMNVLPITQQQDGIDFPALMSTPYFEFFGIKPDYRILFPFGCQHAARQRSAAITTSCFRLARKIGLHEITSDLHSLCFVITFLELTLFQTAVRK